MRVVGRTGDDHLAHVIGRECAGWPRLSPMHNLSRPTELLLGILFFTLAGAITMTRYLRSEMAKDRARRVA